MSDVLLRSIVEEFCSDGNLFDKITKLNRHIDNARHYLQKKDACEFVSEYGIECRDAATRKIRGVWCCERHAEQRDRS